MLPFSSQKIRTIYADALSAGLSVANQWASVFGGFSLGRIQDKGQIFHIFMQSLYECTKDHEPMIRASYKRLDKIVYPLTRSVQIAMGDHGG